MDLVRKAHWLVYAFPATLLALACAEEKAPAPPPLRPLAADVTLPPLAVPEQPIIPPEGLSMSSLPPAAGFLLPESTVPKAQDDNTESYEIAASLEDVIAFYGKRGYEVERNPAGATVRARDGEGLLQVLAGPNRKLELLVFTQTRVPEGQEPPIGKVDPDNPDEATAEARRQAREKLLQDRSQGRRLDPEALKHIPQ